MVLATATRLPCATLASHVFKLHLISLLYVTGRRPTSNYNISLGGVIVSSHCTCVMYSNCKVYHASSNMHPGGDSGDHVSYQRTNTNQLELLHQLRWRTKIAHEGNQGHMPGNGLFWIRLSHHGMLEQAPACKNECEDP